MSKLDIKVLSAYLPYQVEFTDFEIQDSYTSKLTVLNIYDVSKSKELKLHLYSMDMLTKEIEHKGEKFVPLKRLTKWKYDKDNETVFDDEAKYVIIENKYCYPSNDSWTSNWWLQYNSKMMAFDQQEIEGCLPQYDLFQKLTEWHFNVFGLDESEYVQKKSVIQK